MAVVPRIFEFAYPWGARSPSYDLSFLME